MKLYRKQIILCAAIALIAGVVQANEVCNTVSECQKLKWQADAKIQQLQGGISSIGDFLRNTDGTVKTNVNQYQAYDLCKAQGKRLPTARELAVEGTKHGAEILELNQISEGITRSDFRLVSVVNADGKKDKFYYDGYENYARPAGDSANYWIWSSSLHPNIGANIGAYAFRLSEQYGYFATIERDVRHIKSAVRCVSSAGVNR
jgi:hypothetical protein